MKKILLIEDNDDIRNNTAEILELSNYQVIRAENGKVGVEKALAHHPDLIICDIMMPLLDGYGVLHALQKNELSKSIPFIFLTAKSERADFRQGMQAGADDYISKPFDGTELLNAVDARLKKIDYLKTEFRPGLEGFTSFIKASGKDELLSLVEEQNINKYKKKQIVYSEGNHPNRVYYLLKGKVKAYKTNEHGKELVMELFSPGDFLGHVALLEQSVYKDTAETLEECEIAVIPKEEFDELINRNSEVAKKFIQLLARNIAAKETQLLRLAYNSLRKKVADALILLQDKYSHNEDKTDTIDINRESLAAIAGTATESLIRTLGEFRNEKLIYIEDGKITITNQKKLECLVN